MSMNRPELIRAVRELGALMARFEDDRPELLNLIARTRNHLNHLEGQLVAGRPDLQAKIRARYAPDPDHTVEQHELEDFLR